MTEKMIMFENRLRKKFRHGRKQAARLGVEAWRVYDHDLPEFPFCIEIYGNRVYLAEYLRRHKLSDEAHDQWLEACIAVTAAVLETSPDQVFSKLRRRKAGRDGQYQKLESSREFFTVQEDGLTFRINLRDYLDTGLFLDHRDTRKLVRSLSKEKKVLNLFAYTGSFSVYAAAGGASEVVTVDLSNTYLTWARANMEANGFTDPEKYKFIQADVIAWLQQIPADYYDMIVMDPPTFSNSQRMDDILDIRRDHVKLIQQCLHGLVKGGLLFFSTNARQFEPEKEKIAAASFTDITKQTRPFDFESKLERVCYRIQK